MTKQTVIVTGGSSGMGKAMATHLALGGWNVVITGRTEETLETTANEIKQQGGSIAYFPMDVRHPEDADQMVKFAVDTFGDVDALINNAAGNFLVPAEKLSPNGWKAVIDIVLNGTFFCSHAVGNYWIRQKKSGSMINMVATYAWGAGVGVAHSAAAKAGVLSLTRTLAVEWESNIGFA